MNEKADIFICAHSDFDVYPRNSVYKVIHGCDHPLNVDLEQYVETETDLSPFQFSLAEGSRMYWLYKNYCFKDYVGFCQYRKYFGFFEEVPCIEDIFKSHDVVVCRNNIGVSMYQQYAISHRIKDFDDAFIIFSKICPNISNKIRISICQNFMYDCNMFIMRSDDFKEYCNVVFTTIREFCRKRGWVMDSDIVSFVSNHKSEYIKQAYPGNLIEYQSRVLGFILERLTSLYIGAVFKRPYLCDKIMTNNKSTIVYES